MSQNYFDKINNKFVTLPCWIIQYRPDPGGTLEIARDNIEGDVLQPETKTYLIAAGDVHNFEAIKNWRGSFYWLRVRKAWVARYPELIERVSW